MKMNVLGGSKFNNIFKSKKRYDYEDLILNSFFLSLFYEIIKHFFMAFLSLLSDKWIQFSVFSFIYPLRESIKKNENQNHFLFPILFNSSAFIFF